MNTALRITVFAAALAASFGAAYGVGSVIAPVRTDPEPATRVEHGEGHGDGTEGERGHRKDGHGGPVGAPRVPESGYLVDPT
ncbi:hypothetical protein ACWGDX_08405 [Streptomyces sp. NPDC055025]